jgi:hypothetical protein
MALVEKSLPTKTKAIHNSQLRKQLVSEPLSSRQGTTHQRLTKALESCWAQSGRQEPGKAREKTQQRYLKNQIRK